MTHMPTITPAGARPAGPEDMRAKLAFLHSSVAAGAMRSGGHDAGAKMRQLAKQEAGPGYIHFAGHLDIDWFKQLVVERILIVYKSNVAKRVWDCPRGKRNEALDCLVYATAARYSMEVDFAARRHYLTQKQEDQPTLADLAGVFA